MYNKRWETLTYCLWIIFKRDHSGILEDEYESYCGGVLVEWFISRMSYYKELFKGIFSINVPLKKDSITPLTNMCCFCKDYMDRNIVDDHLNGKFGGYAHNKCDLQAKNNFVPIYAFNSTNYVNHLFIIKLAEKVRIKVLTKTDENYICIDMGHTKALDMFRFFHPLSLNKISCIVHNNELGKLKDEIPNDTIMEACFLKAKAFCLNTVQGEEEKKLEGIT